MDYEQIFSFKKNQHGEFDFSFKINDKEDINIIAYFLILKLNSIAKTNELERLMSLKFKQNRILINSDQCQKVISLADSETSLYKTNIILRNKQYCNDFIRDLAQMHSLTNLLLVIKQNSKERINEESNIWFNKSGIRIEDFDTNQVLIITNKDIYYINGLDEIPNLRVIQFKDFLNVFKRWVEFLNNLNY